MERAIANIDRTDALIYPRDHCTNYYR